MLAKTVATLYLLSALSGSAYCVLTAYSKKENSQRFASALENNIIHAQLLTALAISPILLHVHNAICENLLNNSILTELAKSLFFPIWIVGMPVITSEISEKYYNTVTAIKPELKKDIIDLAISYIITNITMRLSNRLISALLPSSRLFAIFSSSLSAVIGTAVNTIFMLKSYCNLSSIEEDKDKFIFAGCAMLLALLNVSSKMILSGILSSLVESNSLIKQITAEIMFPMLSLAIGMLASVGLSVYLQEYSINYSSLIEEKKFRTTCEGLLYSAIPHIFCAFPL